MGRGIGLPTAQEPGKEGLMIILSIMVVMTIIIPTPLTMMVVMEIIIMTIIVITASLTLRTVSRDYFEMLASQG